MMEREAVVTRIEGGHAYVELAAAGGCGRCHEKGGCRSGVFDQLFDGKPRRFRLANRIGAIPGERVLVQIADGAPLRIAMLTYFLPVLLLVAGAAAASVWKGNDDAWIGLGALTGFAIGVLAGLTLGRRLTTTLGEPELVRRDPTTCLSKKDCR